MNQFNVGIFSTIFERTAAMFTKEIKLRILFYALFICLHGSLFGQSPEVVPINTGERISLYSKILDETREIYVYTPSGLWGMDEQMENLPVVYVLDGESQFLNTAATIDYLSAASNGNDLLPRSLVVAIPNTDRTRDLTPIKGMMGQDSSTIEQTGGGAKFLDFITSELIPYIDDKYSTCHQRTIIGHSLGGLLAFEALLKKRNYFNNYIAIDPAFGFANQAYLHEVLDTLRTSNLLDENLFFAVANTRPSFVELKDLLNDTSEMLQQMDIPNQKFLKLSESEQWQLNLSVKYYSDENHFSVPYRATYDAMKYFYNFYTFKEINNFYHPEYADKNDLLDKLIKHYEEISDLMGCETNPMQGYLNSFAFGLGHFGRDDLAIDLLMYNISLHPNNPILYNNLGFYYRNSGRYKEAIVEFDKSLILVDDENIRDVRDLLIKD